MPQPADISQEDDELREISVTLIEPSNLVRYFVPPVFRNQIKLHFVKSTMPDLLSPLILAVQGATGQGKTFQSLEVFSQIGVYVLLVFGFELSGKYEGGPVRKMQKLYGLALENQNKLGRPTAVVIDDFDNSVASVRTDDHSGYTVNTQLLTDYFMNLPRKIPRGYTPVPLILTGNNFLDMYGPLLRYGRMSFFDWNGPTDRDKIEILRKIFANTMEISDLSRINLLIEEFPEQPLAFFTDLRNAAYDDFIVQMFDSMDSLDIGRIHNAIRTRVGQVTINELIPLGRALLQNRPKDFLTQERVVREEKMRVSQSDERAAKGETK